MVLFNAAGVRVLPPVFPGLGIPSPRSCHGVRLRGTWVSVVAGVQSVTGAGEGEGNGSSPGGSGVGGADAT